MRDEGSGNTGGSAWDRVQAAMLAREMTTKSKGGQTSVDKMDDRVEAVQANDRVDSVNPNQSNDRVAGFSQLNDRVDGFSQSNVPSEEEILGMWTSQPEEEESDDDAKAFAQVTTPPSSLPSCPPLCQIPS